MKLLEFNRVATNELVTKKLINGKYYYIIHFHFEVSAEIKHCVNTSLFTADKICKSQDATYSSL